MLLASITLGRTGLPTCTLIARTFSLTPFSIANPVATRLTRPARKRFARPITAFCSCKIEGARKSDAASSGGTVG